MSALDFVCEAEASLYVHFILNEASEINLNTLQQVLFLLGYIA